MRCGLYLTLWNSPEDISHCSRPTGPPGEPPEIFSMIKNIFCFYNIFLVVVAGTAPGHATVVHCGALGILSPCNKTQF